MNLTREEARQWIPILQAFVEGKEFQMWNGFYESDDDGYLCRPESCWDDIDTSEVFPITFGDYGIMDKPEYYFRIKE